MSDGLVLSLGHNSSAILIRDNQIICGYEEERMTGVKSDSRFPRKSIEEIHARYTIREDVDIAVSHWELFGDVDKMSPKHWDRKYLSERFPKSRIFSVNSAFTHHDAHAWSAVLFAGEDFPTKVSDNTYIFVVDGFGTFGEHMSFYRFVDGLPILLERKYGFGTSLGLLYQYTTAFLGMKQNQDEYKLLAYEAHIDRISNIRSDVLRECIESYTGIYLARIKAFMPEDRTDPMLSISALPAIAQEIGSMLSAVLTSVVTGELTEWERRVIIAYFVQSLVENVMMSKVRDYSPANLVLVGGVFLNVKLNNIIAQAVPGLTCVMPLAGDQGAGLGVYKAIHQDLEWPGHLFWGDRTLTPNLFTGVTNMIYVENAEDGFAAVKHELSKREMVNVIYGNMEFGPRALGHTSTIALPHLDIAQEINRMNQRTNEMPFAPMMTKDQAMKRLGQVNSIHKSLEYMICTRDFVRDEYQDMLGAAHKYPNEIRYSARPQIIHSGPYRELLNHFGPLINTSFNFHGVPIVWNAEQIRNTHTLEQINASEHYSISTIVIPQEVA